MAVLAATGGRDFGDRQFVYDTLDFAVSHYHMHKLLVGDCPSGADLFCREWIVEQQKKVEYEVFYAEWQKHGLVAGPIRNQEMLNKFPDYLIAFPGNKGTNGCVKIAKKMWIPVIDHRYRH